MVVRPGVVGVGRCWGAATLPGGGPVDPTEPQSHPSQIKARWTAVLDAHREPRRAALFVLIKDGERLDEELNRAPDPSKGGSSGDPEVQVGTALKRLRAIFPTTYAACFGNRGDR
jgi:hypothetical protein